MSKNIKVPEGYTLLDWSAISTNKLPRSITDRINSSNRQKKEEVSAIYKSCRKNYCINANGQVLVLKDNVWLKCPKHTHSTTGTAYYQFEFYSPNHRYNTGKMNIPLDYFSFQTYNAIKNATQQSTQCNSTNEVDKLKNELAGLQALNQSLQLQVEALSKNLKEQKAINNQLLSMLQRISEIAKGVK